MRFWTRMAILGSVLALAGCGYYRWQKPGASAADFKADQSACATTGISGLAFNACMQQRGWVFN